MLIVAGLADSLVNFRGALIDSLLTKGVSVHVAAPIDGASKETIKYLSTRGVIFHGVDLVRTGMNPAGDLKALFQLCKIINRNKFDTILAYTIKPVIWGGIASRICKGAKFYALITGLGFAFQSGGMLKNLLVKVVTCLYKIALRNSSATIFQNKDNMNTFLNLRIVSRSKCHIVNGSGVDLQHFKLDKLPVKPKFLLIARLLADKGIREYLNAAAKVKKLYPTAEFHLVGPEDPSPNAIRSDELKPWIMSGVVLYHGAASDVRPFLKDCSIFVLPSYHEGMPRTVLEAMAMGRPILTTNVPGCRDTVVNGLNGWLVEKANVEQLAERMMWFIQHPESWQKMGADAHRMAIDKFDVNKVNAEIIDILGVDSETGV